MAVAARAQAAVAMAEEKVRVVVAKVWAAARVWVVGAWAAGGKVKGAAAMVWPARWWAVARVAAEYVVATAAESVEA